jgi:FkbM family methyltransferase
MQRTRDVFVLQIGANAGSDQIHRLISKYRLRGLLVEPQPAVFRRLINAYADEPQIKFANQIIGQADGWTTLFTVSDDGRVPDWITEAASLDKRQLRKVLRWWQKQNKKIMKAREVEALITETILPSVTFATLLHSNNVDAVDLLCIDAMGFDSTIIRMIPFDHVTPSIIQFEHSLLPAPEQQASYQYLSERGYSFAQVGVDTIAYRSDEWRPGRFLPWPKV